MGPLCKSGIYVGYETPSIIRFLDPATGHCHMARFADCSFDEDLFPTLGGDNQPLDDKSPESRGKPRGSMLMTRELLSPIEKSKR